MGRAWRLSPPRWQLIQVALVALPLAIAAALVNNACAFASKHPTRLPAAHTPTQLSALQKGSYERRALLKGIVPCTLALPVTSFVQSSPAAAAMTRGPFAPVDTLLPAARVKVMIDRAVEVATQLAANTKNSNTKQTERLLDELSDLLLQPQNFTRGTTPLDVPQQPAKSYLDAYTSYRNRVSLLEKPGAMLVQNGEIDTWKRLKRQEKVREGADEVRAALNFYTSNLNYTPDRFVLTGSKEERSQLIRNDKLPDVKNVIASDMGLRYLLRNEVLTALDEARAELRYQMRQQDDGGVRSVDGGDLVGLLVEAQVACGKWFDLIDKEDVKAALDAVQ